MGRTRIRAAVAALVGVALLGAACGAGGDDVVARRDSNVRGEAAAGNDPVEPSGDTGPYCDVAGELRAESIDLDDDPAAAIDGLERLRDEAPQELGDDFDVVIDVTGRLAELDQDDPASLGEVFELAFDPAMIAALAQIDRYTRAACGFTLDADSDDGGDDPFGGDPFGDDPDGFALPDDDFLADDPDAIRLSDIDAVKEANEGASWVAKLNSTIIGGGTDVQVAATVDPLGADEALAACRALREQLAAKNPDVRITVLNEETPIVNDETGTCAPA